MLPLWQESQRPVASVWLMVTDDHDVVLRWQFSQTLVVIGWVGVLPVAVVPLWQLEQLPVTPVWLNDAGVHAVVRWQELHSAVVTMCVAVLPVAAEPL